jgi:uncharacterized membrane protein HdeD (DUF308 family)
MIALNLTRAASSPTPCKATGRRSTTARDHTRLCGDSHLVGLGTTLARMTPLRWFYGLYLVTFGVTVVVAFSAMDYVRWPMFALGALLAVFGLCLLTNFMNFASETASNAGKSKWAAPAMTSVPLVRGIGVFFMLGGVAFAAQALLVDNL